MIDPSKPVTLESLLAMLQPQQPPPAGPTQQSMSGIFGGGAPAENSLMGKFGGQNKGGAK